MLKNNIYADKVLVVSDFFLIFANDLILSQQVMHSH